MLPINIGDLASNMLKAALPKLTGGGEKTADFAKDALTDIAKTIARIGEDYANGKMGADDAKAALDAQKESAKIAIAAAEGLSLIAIEEAINAALGVVKTTVNSALGFALIV